MWEKICVTEQIFSLIGLDTAYLDWGYRAGTEMEEWLGQISAPKSSEMNDIKGKEISQNQRQNSRTWNREV